MEHYKRLFNDDGSFKPSKEKPEGFVSISYLEEACEWVCFREDLSNEDKLQRVLNIESVISRILKDYGNIQINYIPTWSTFLKTN